MLACVRKIGRPKEPLRDIDVTADFIDELISEERSTTEVQACEPILIVSEKARSSLHLELLAARYKALKAADAVKVAFVSNGSIENQPDFPSVVRSAQDVHSLNCIRGAHVIRRFGPLIDYVRRQK